MTTAKLWSKFCDLYMHSILLYSISAGGRGEWSWGFSLHAKPLLPGFHTHVHESTHGEWNRKKLYTVWDSRKYSICHQSCSFYKHNSGKRTNSFRSMLLVNQQPDRSTNFSQRKFLNFKMKAPMIIGLLVVAAATLSSATSYERKMVRSTLYYRIYNCYYCVTISGDDPGRLIGWLASQVPWSLFLCIYYIAYRRKSISYSCMHVGSLPLTSISIAYH